MSQNSPEEFSVQQVFELISNHFKNERLFETLLSTLHEEPNYKRLLATGENQFLDAPQESDIETESVKSRLCFAKLNHLSMEIVKDIDRIVKEKFQGEFLHNLKEQVLQAVLLLASNPNNDSDVTSRILTLIKSEKEEEKQDLPQTKTLSNNCVKNNSTVKKEAKNVTNGTAKASFEIDDGDADFCISFDSVSSVHTSDLSSFEDEISLSSDEDFGDKKRLSLKEVKEKLEQSGKFEIMEADETDEKVENIQHEDNSSESHVNGNESSSISYKSQRRRKPSTKYTNDDIILTTKKKSAAKISSSKSVCGDMLRKRGRPRKHST